MKISNNLKKAAKDNDSKRLHMVYRDVVNKYVTNTPMTKNQMKNSIPTFTSSRSKMANARAVARAILSTTPDEIIDMDELVQIQFPFGTF